MNTNITSEKNRVAQELYEMRLEKMDFDVVKKILSDHIADEAVVEDQMEISEDDRFLELDVENLEDGLKKASALLEVPIRELRYKITANVRRIESGKVVELKKIEFRRKIVSGMSEVVIAEDRLSAYLSVVFPKTLDGKLIDEDYIMKLLQEQNINYGILKQEIKDTIEKLRQNYDVLKNVTVAKAQSPVNGTNPEIVNAVFQHVENVTYVKKYEKHLFELFVCQSLKFVKENYFPAKFVSKGELIVSTSLPTDGTDGKDIFGNVLEAIKGKYLFTGGKNVTTKIEGNQVRYYSDIFGYLEHEDGVLTVYSPFWVSENAMRVYFIGLPNIDEEYKKIEADEIKRHLNSHDISFGIVDHEVKNICQKIKDGITELTLVKVASGTEVLKGDDAIIELFFDENKQAGKILEDGRLDYRERNVIKTVKQNQLLAVKYPPQKGTMGKNVRDEIIPAEYGSDTKFEPYNNIKLVKGQEKTLYYSTIEGRVVLVGDSGISVNKVFEVKGNVDYHTGNVDFNGDVEVSGGVLSGFKITANGNITINGMVNQGVELFSEGNIVVKQGIIGRNNDTIVKAKGRIYAQYVQNAQIESGSDIFIKDYIMNSVVKSSGKIITPDREGAKTGKGALLGGELFAVKGISANTIGSDYTKITKIIVGMDYDYDLKLKNINKAFNYCDIQLNKLSKFLRLGLQDFSTLKQRIIKLPREKQMPYIEAFKKFNELNQLKRNILNKKSTLAAESDELSRSAKILVNKALYPKVQIQIGDMKILNEKLLLHIMILESKDRKQINIEKMRG